MWRADMSEILRTFDVREFQFTVPTVSELSQGDPRHGSGINQYVQGSVDLGPSAPAPMMVGCYFSTSVPPTADRPHNVGYVSVIYWDI